MLASILAVSILIAQDAPRVLSDQQINMAIQMGRANDVPIVQVGTRFGVSKGDFDVFIEGPLARIAAAASSAQREYRSFDGSNITADLRQAVFRLIFKRIYDFHVGQRTTPIGDVKHVVLQPHEAKGMDGVIQPLREFTANNETFFDRLPEGEFDVVIVTSETVQRYNVSAKQRAKIQ